jgi:hypothetical protein
MNIKTYRILQYIQPWEIDDLERQVHKLISSSYHINTNISKIIWDVTLNTETVDWHSSMLPKDYFINKFKYLATIVDYYYVAKFEINNDIKGCSDKRRTATDTEQDYIIWLDSDLFFSKYVLPSLITSTDLIKDQLYIVSPEIIKWWDDSWNSIVNKKYINEPFNHRDNFDINSFDTTTDINNISVKLNNSIIKFGGGWFNLFTNDIFQKLSIPEQIGAYGPDDLWYMICGGHVGIKQYILEGIVVSEIGNKFLINKNYIKPMLKVKIQDKARISDNEFNTLVSNFYKNL